MDDKQLIAIRQYQKYILRQRLRTIRCSVQNKEQKDKAITRHLIHSIAQIQKIRQKKHIKNLFIYQSTQYEVDTKSIIEYYQNSLKIFVPYVDKLRNEMFAQKFTTVLSNDTLVDDKTTFNLKLSDTLHNSLDDSITIVPIVGFTKYNYRLGQGGGYYDRYLASANTLSIGLAYDEQFCDYIPLENHDIPLNAIITPSNIMVNID